MNALSLVRDDRNPELLRIINEGDYNLSHLQQKYGISAYYLKKDYGAKAGRRGRPKASQARKKALDQPKEITLNTNKHKDITQETVSKEITPYSKRLELPSVQQLIGIGCLAVALGLCAVNAFMNYRFGMSFGQDEGSRTALGASTFLIDCGSLLLFAAAGYLWEGRRHWWLPPALCLLAFFGWGMCMGLSASAALGFASSNIGDTLQARESVRRHREAVEAQKARAEAEIGEILEKRDPQIIEQQIQIEQGKVPEKNRAWSQNCTNVTKSGPECLYLNRARAAKVAAEQRIYLDAKIRMLSTEIAAMPPISAKDPGPEQISQMADGAVTAEQVRNYMIRCLAFIISISPGILLAIARTLLR